MSVEDVEAMSVEEAVNEAVQAAACLFHSDASSDLEPPNPAKLHELLYNLKEIVDHVRCEGSSDDRVMLLSHRPFCLAVLETLVFALRPPQQQSGFAEWLEVLPDISDCASGLLQAAMQEGSREAYAAATVLVHALLRSQVLQAFSELIAISTAAVGYSLADANPAAAAEAWGPFPAVQTQSAGAATATPTQMARTSELPKAGESGLVTQILMKIASSVVREALVLVFQLYVLSMQLWCSALYGEPSEAPEVMAAGSSLCAEVTAQLHDSNILEHASRLVLVAAEAGRRPWPDVDSEEAREAARWLWAAAASGAAALDDTGEEEDEGHGAAAAAGFMEGLVGVKGMLTRTVIPILSNALTTLLSVHGTLASTPAGMIMNNDASAALRAVLLGACFSHAAFSGQVVALAALDERTCYGLPEHTALFLRTLLLTCAEDGGEVQDVLHDVIQGVLQPSLGNPATSFPAPGFMLALVRRAGALLLSSAKAWAAREGAIGQWGEDCGGQLPSSASGSTALSAAAAAVGGAASSVPSSAASIAASASAQGQAAGDEEVATAQPAARGQCGRVLLARDSICSLTLLAISRLDAALGELTDRDSPRWMQVAAERWRLAVGVAQEAVGWARERVATRLAVLAGSIRIDVDPVYRFGGGSLPANAPRRLGPPLGAGVVPFLQRTFRAAGRCPRNPEALLLEAIQGRSGDTVLCSNLLLYWAYDNGSEAYPLVRSIVKCLLRFERQVADHIVKGIRVGDSSGEAATAAVAVAVAESHGSSSRGGEDLRAGPAASGGGAGDDGVSGGGGGGGDIMLPLGVSSVLRVCRGVLVEGWHFLSLSPHLGQPPAAVEQLRRLLSFCVCLMLPPLSRIVRRVAAAQQLAEQQSKAAAASVSGGATRSSSSSTTTTITTTTTTTTTASTTINNSNGGHDPDPRGKAMASDGGKPPAASDAVEHLWNVIEPLLCWLPTLSAACTASSVADWGPTGTRPLSGQRAFNPKRMAAKAAAAASAAAADPEGSAIRREGWRRLLLEEMGPLEALGAALRLRPFFPAQHFVAALDKSGVNLLLGIAVSGVARGCRQELEAAHRQAGLEAIEAALQAAAGRGPAAAATPSGVAAAAARRSTTAGVRSGASRASAKAPAAEAASGSSDPASGSSASASAARPPTPTGTIAQAYCKNSLALWPLAQLQKLEGTLRRWGRTGLAEEVCAVRVARKGLAALEATADGATAYPPPYLAAGLALLPPDVAQRAGLTAGCANPGCTNLEGDSERALPLRACARCGAVRYCCRECQMAHWQAPRGHKGECHGGPRTVPAGGGSAS